MNWDCKLEIAELWGKFPDSISQEDFLKGLIEKFSALNPHPSARAKHTELIELLKEFEKDVLAGVYPEQEMFEEEFNWIWGAVYDWADTPCKVGTKTCWIATF